MSGPNGGPIGNLPGAALDLSNVQPVAPVDFNAQRIINVANPVNPQDVVTLDYFNNNPPAGVAAITLANITPVADVDFSNQKLVNVANPTNPQDVVTLDYFNTNPPAGAANIPLNNILPVADVDFNGQKLIDVADPTNPQDVVTLNYFNNNPGGGANRQLSNLLGTQINANLTYANASLLWTIQSQDNPTGNVADMIVRTGNHNGNQINGNGNITIITGSKSGAATSSGDTGNVSLRTGSISVSGPTNANTGNITLFTGGLLQNDNSGATGLVRLNSGDNNGTGGSGDVSIFTGNTQGNAFGAESGDILIDSGQTGGISTRSGLLRFRSGPTTGATAQSGKVEIRSGQSSNWNSGDIEIITGVAGNIRGIINLEARQIDYNYTPNKDHVWESGVTGTRPASPVTGTTYFDTTLGQPIWYDGAAWVDATGAAV